MAAFLTTTNEGGSFRVSLADGGELPLMSAPAIPGTGTVTSVTGTAPIVITGSPTATPNVTIVPATDSVPGSMSAADKTKLDATPAFPTADLTAAGLVQQVSGLAPSAPLVVNFPLPSTVESYLSLHRASGGSDLNVGPFTGFPAGTGVWCGVTGPFSTTNYNIAFLPTLGVQDYSVPTVSGQAVHQFFADTTTQLFLTGKSSTGQGTHLTSASTAFGGGVGVVGVQNAATEPSNNVGVSSLVWSFTNGALKVRSANGYKANLVALGAGAPNTQAVFVDTFSSVLRTVSSAAPANFSPYTTQTGTVGWINVRLKSKAATAGVGVAAGDGAFAEYRLGYKNVAGTVTLSTAGITLLGAVQTTAAALTATLTAAAVGATVVFSVTNVNLATIDSQIDCTIDVC